MRGMKRWSVVFAAALIACGCPVSSDPPPSQSACPGVDADQDGVTSCGLDGVFGTFDDDCDDTDASASPGAVELCDGVDNNCDGIIWGAEVHDEDGDGVVQCADCDDTEPTVFIGAPELCDELDNDCDGLLRVDETTDADSDDAPSCLDCDDAEPATFPSAPELCDGLDNDCDGVVPSSELTDGDSDGAMLCDDCDDLDPTRFPGAAELCDLVDNDCDGTDPATETNDDDFDGFMECEECDDSDNTRFPGAPELCDGLDNDCDGVVLPAELTDADSDGTPLCDDCDDSDTTSSPAAPELCDGLDNDCDGVVPPTETTDADSDGTPLCDDCDDEEPTVFPGAPELCDGLDNNCDGTLSSPEQVDGDGDGAGICFDCDDADQSFNPLGQEWCDGLDHDCDGSPHPGWLVDADGDGAPSCADCDDNDPTSALSPVGAAVTGTACEALDWVLDHSLVASFVDLQDSWEAEALTFGDGSCPAMNSSTTTSSVPGPYACQAILTTPWSLDETNQSWATGCATAQHALSGAMTRQSDDQYVNVCSQLDDTLALQEYTATGVAGLQVNASIDRSEIEAFTLFPQTIHTLSISGTFQRDGPVPASALTDAYPSGVTDASLAVSKSPQAPGWGPLVYYVTTNSTAHADTTPWVASGNLSFGFSINVPAAATLFTGCAVEPTGTLSVDLLSAPGGSVLTTVAITFDPATACDGCGEVTQNGVPLGSACSGLWDGDLTGGD